MRFLKPQLNRTKLHIAIVFLPFYMVSYSNCFEHGTKDKQWFDNSCHKFKYKINANITLLKYQNNKANV